MDQLKYRLFGEQIRKLQETVSYTNNSAHCYEQQYFLGILIDLSSQQSPPHQTKPYLPKSFCASTNTNLFTSLFPSTPTTLACCWRPGDARKDKTTDKVFQNLRFINIKSQQKVCNERRDLTFAFDTPSSITERIAAMALSSCFAKYFRFFDSQVSHSQICHHNQQTGLVH